MDRKEFLKVCSGVCLGAVGMSVLLQSCATSQTVTGIVSGNRLQLSKTAFEKSSNEKISYRKYIITRVENLDYPIVIYRNNADNYTALLLRCTHQGNEVSVSGDLLSCSAHGSEFDRTGTVIQGPAEINLVSYPVTSDEKNIYVQLS